MQSLGIETWMLFMLPPLLLGALLLVSKSLRGLAWVAAGMLVLASISPHKPWGSERYTQTWILPLQVKRSEVFFLFAAMLGFGVLIQSRKLVGARLPMIALGLLGIGLYMALLRSVHEDPGDAAFTAFGVILSVFSLGFAAVATTQDRAGMLNLMRSIAMSGMGWLALVMVQFVINREMITVPRPPRLIGLSPNPQAAAIFLGPVAVTMLWLAMNDPWRLARLVWYPAVGFFMLMLLWTGSRTGAAMFVIGGAAVTYTRLGKAVFMVPVLGLVLWLLVSVLQGLGIELSDRVTSTENTRSAVWQRLLSSGLSNPIIGVGQGEDLGSENSFLLGFAAYGIGMLAIILAFAGMIGWMSVKLLRAKRVLPAGYGPYIDICHGYFAAYLFGSIFEGYILARVASNLVLMLLFAGLAARLLWMARSIQAGVPVIEDAEFAVSHEGEGDEPEALDWGEQAAGGSWGVPWGGSRRGSRGEESWGSAYGEGARDAGLDEPGYGGARAV